MNQEIPDGWNKVKFKELAKQKSVRIDNPGESGFEKYVGLEHLDSGELVVKRYGSTSDVTSTMKLFNKGDILFARRNTYLKRVSVAPFDGVCSGDIIVLEPILEHIVEGFLPIFMQFEPFENKIIALSAGAFSKRIKWKQLAEEDIVIPSIEEQNKIVEVLWSIQDTIEKNERLKNTTEILKKGLLNKLLIKGIGHKEFQKTEIGEIPAEWKLVHLKDIVEDDDGIKRGPWGSSIKKAFFVDSGYKVYEQKNVLQNDFGLGKYYITPNKFNELKQFEVKSEDILITGAGTVGKVAIVPNNIPPGVFNQALVRIRLNDKILIKYFLYLFKYYVSTDILDQYAEGAVQKNFTSIKSLGKIEVPLPSISEQRALLKIFIQMDGNVDNYSYNIESLNNFKKKLTNNFISGKLIIPKEVL